MNQSKQTANVQKTWISELDLEDTLSVLDGFAIRHALRGGPTGAKIYDAIKRCAYDELVGFELNVNSEGWDVLHLIECRQALAFYQKLEPLPVEPEKELVAYNAFQVSELQCMATNKRFRSIRRGPLWVDPRVMALLLSAKRKIRKILGTAPKISELKLRFGPGGTTSIKKEEANPQRKLAETPQCSEQLLRSGFLPELLRELPHWLDCHGKAATELYENDTQFTWLSDSLEPSSYEITVLDVEISPSHLGFVPKNAKTYRGIDIQPTLNTLLQGGIGRWMKSRLAKAGISITDQTINQRFARQGSISNLLATLDLQSASDSIATELVRFLLDDDWFVLLQAAGSGTTLYKGEVIRLEKFASMGNGFTFPLETLIFWALTAAACEGSVSSVSAYGDDIICPSDRAESVIGLLEYCGFTVNTKKSYISGPFRESCGADYYLGIDTRPFYQENLVSGESLFVLHNFYVRHHDSEMAQAVLDVLNPDLLIFGPDGYGDGHLIREDWTGYRTRVMRRRGYGGLLFDTYQRVPQVIPNLYPGDYVTPLYTIYCAGDTPSKEVDLSWLLYCYNWEPMPGLEYLANGRVLWPLPGSSGYRKVSIYTFAR